MKHTELRRLCAAAALSVIAATGSSARADTLSVVLRDLPPGLDVLVRGTGCSFVEAAPIYSSVGWMRLAEQSTTVYEQVLFDGKWVLRSRVVTTYSGQATVTPPANRCSLTGVGRDYSFTAGIAGTTKGKDSVQRALALGNADSQPTIAYDLSLYAGTQWIHNSSTSGMAKTLLRNEPAIVIVHYADNLDGGGGGNAWIDDAKLDFARTDDLAALLYGGVTLSVNRAGRACIRAAGSTRCAGDAPGPLIHGGIQLTSFSLSPVRLPDRSVSEALFLFTPTFDFPAGTYRLTASANDVDLLAYRVDGQLQKLDLLPWRARAVEWTVQ